MKNVQMIDNYLSFKISVDDIQDIAEDIGIYLNDELSMIVLKKMKRDWSTLFVINNPVKVIQTLFPKKTKQPVNLDTMPLDDICLIGDQINHLMVKNGCTQTRWLFFDIGTPVSEIKYWLYETYSLRTETVDFLWFRNSESCKNDI